MATISPQAAIVYVMVTVSASDADMTDRELRKIGDIIRMFPFFKDFDGERLLRAAKDCATILNADDQGLEAVMGLAKEALSANLRETAYAFAIEVAAADNRINAEEGQVLEMIRSVLGVDRLVAAAIERSARVRHAAAPHTN